MEGIMHEVPGNSEPLPKPSFEETLDKLENELYWAPVDVRNATVLTGKSYVGMDELQRHIGLLRDRKQKMEDLLGTVLEHHQELRSGESERYADRIEKMVKDINTAETALNAIPVEKIY